MAIHHLHTEIEIDASAERMWAVLSNFSSYPQWNPFIRSVIGAPRQGAGGKRSRKIRKMTSLAPGCTDGFAVVQPER